MANVLKPDTPSDRIPAAHSVSGLAGFNLSDLADEGRDQLQRCRSQIRQMLEEAEAQAKSIRSEAQASGYQAGLERAAVDADRKLAEQADARAKESLRLIRSAVQQLHTMHEQWMQQYSQSLSAIALAASERILHRKLKDEPQLIALWAEEAIRSTRSSASLTLAVHPETMAQLGQSLDELLAAPDCPSRPM